VGLVGGILLAVSMVPQIIKLLITKSGKDISYGMQLILLTGLVCLFYYTLVDDIPAVFWPVAAEILINSCLFALKVYFDNYYVKPDPVEEIKEIELEAQAEDKESA